MRKLNQHLDEAMIWEQLKGKMKYSQESELNEASDLRKKIDAILNGKKVKITFSEKEVDRLFI